MTLNVTSPHLWKTSILGNASVEYVVPGTFLTLAFLGAVVFFGLSITQWFSSSQNGSISNGLIAVQPLGSNAAFPTQQGSGQSRPVNGTSTSNSAAGIGPPPDGWTQTCFTGGLCLNIPPAPPVTSAGLGNQQITIFASMLQSLASQLAAQLGPNDPLVTALNSAAGTGNRIGGQWGVLSNQGGAIPPLPDTVFRANSNFDPLGFASSLANIKVNEQNLSVINGDINSLLNNPQYQSLLASNPGLGNLINFLITGITSLSQGFTYGPGTSGGIQTIGSYNVANLNSYTSYLNAAGLQAIAQNPAAPPPPPPPPPAHP